MKSPRIWTKQNESSNPSSASGLSPSVAMVLANHPDAASPVLAHFSLKGKNAIVTGGSKGIGLEVARGLLEAGASVAITYASTPLDQVEALIDGLAVSAGPRATVKAYHCVAEDRDSVFAAVNSAAENFGGRLDIVVVNAGYGEDCPAEDYPEDKFRKIFDVNVSGAFWTAQRAAQIMRGTPDFHRGSIIFTCSISATLVNIPQHQSAYNASKAAVLQLARSLAVEWVDFARVNCISPVCISYLSS